MTKAITTHYHPDQCIGDWGWIWLPTSMAEAGEWVICRTIEDDEDAEGLLLETWDCDSTSDTHDVRDAYELEGTPYLSVSAPTCEPGAALEVTVRLEGGSTIAMAWGEGGTRADDVRDAVMKALVPKGTG